MHRIRGVYMARCLAETGFGYIVISDKRYDHDVVIYPGGRVEKRRKELSSAKRDMYGHTPLSGEELGYYLSAAGNIDCLVIGTGQYGALPLDDKAKRIIRELRDRGVSVVVDKTPAIVERCDEILSRCKNPLVIVHVTC